MQRCNEALKSGWHLPSLQITSANLTRFHSRQAPPITIGDYLKRYVQLLCSYCDIAYFADPTRVFISGPCSFPSLPSCHFRAGVSNTPLSSALSFSCFWC